MDFDHRDPAMKRFSLAAGKSLLKNRGLIAAEIAKCDIVCANCHRIRTHLAQVRGDLPGPPHEKKESTPERLRGRAKFKEARGLHVDLLRAFRSTPCADCHVTLPWYVMEFDHRDPWQKVGVVSRLAGHVSLQRLLDEVAKCDIVCANCHRVRTYARREADRASAGVS